MNSEIPCLTRVFARLLGICMVFAWALPARAAINTSIDQTVWMMLYGVNQSQLNSAAWLAADDDGDGLNNGNEMIAGTNPFNGNSNIAVSSVVAGTNGLTFTFPTQPGKLYALQSATNPSSSWTTLSPAVQIEGNGSPMSLVAPKITSGSNLFYRVTVQDVDTYGFGVSDWAEDVTGFSPSAFTSGTASYQTTLLQDLALENVVTVTATKATATQPAPGTNATDDGTITVTRGGVLLFSSIIVPLKWGGTAIPGVDYSSLPSSVTIPAHTNSVTISVVPMANAGRLSGATATANVMPGGGYSLGSTQSASVVINPAGNTNGTGLIGSYYNETSKTITPYNASVLFSGTAALTRLDPTVSFTWNGTSPGAGVNTTYFATTWQGQVQPQYSETYYFDVTADDGVMLWVNGQLLLNSWSYTGSADRLASINLQAGVLYDIRLDYYQATGNDSVDLYWYSNDQSREIIPSNRLYPYTSAPAPPAITSTMSAFGFVNQAFSFNVTASVSGGSLATFGLGAASGPLPPGLTLNPSTGLISGTPAIVGNYQVALTASNAYGVGASVLDIQILPPGSGVTRELWYGLSGTSVSDIPLTTTPASIDAGLSTLEDNTAYASNTGERLRGYFTAPVTGNYYFWLAANNNAELWIADDNQTVDLVKRASVTAPGTGVESWNTAGQTNQQSQWLSLNAGQTYYYEVYHNTGASSGTASNVAVAYMLDTTGTYTTPTGTGVAPAYLLTAYSYPPQQSTSGALFTTQLSPEPGVKSSAAGTATLQLNVAANQAFLQFNYTNLSSPQTSYAVWGPDDDGVPTILFDINVEDKFHPNLISPAGVYTWNLSTTSSVTISTIVNDIEEGLAYIQIETVNYPNGEISGNFFLTIGSETAPQPTPDPGYTDDSATDAGAARFLNQAAFGAAPSDLAAVKSEGYATWIANQMALPGTHTLPLVNAYAALVDNTPYTSADFQNAWWNVSITAPDQLRQRVALALSEILVISDQNASLADAANGLGSYYDKLMDDAFGNFRNILQDVTLHPAMGWWLNMEGNAKGNLATGYHPNENYAREVMQLFTIGLNRLWPDSSTVLNTYGSPVPTYNQNTITDGLARVFTGWAWHQALQSNGQLPTSFSPATDWVDPMVMVKNYHELGTKTILDNVVLPQAVGYSPIAAAVAGSQADTTSTNYDNYCLGDLQKGLDNIFNHPNVGPFICRELIQRLVESNPSSGYVYRVTQKFNDDGSAAHVRGNMAAVITAILLDGEARNESVAEANTASGKQREPLLRIAAPARTFLSSSNSGNYIQSGTPVMTVNTNNPSEFRSGDSVRLDFSPNDSGNPPVAPFNNPTTGNYTVLTTPAPGSNSFSVNAAGLLVASYSEPAGSGTLTINTSNGPPAGENCYLDFITGSIPNGIYTVTGNPSSSQFTVATTSTSAVALSGTLVVPRIQGYVTVTTPKGALSSTLTMTTTFNGYMNVGDPVWVETGSTSQLGDAQYNITSVIGPETYTLTSSGTYRNITSPLSNIYPLVGPPLSRSGEVNIGSSSFILNNTNSTLAQTPLDSPTVFNFFYPGYEYPGSLATSNITTPEFQLTNASNLINLTNAVASMVLSSGNTDGLSSFQSGAINLDLSAYMEAPYVSYSNATVTSGTTVTITTTSTVNYTQLVSELSNILTGGLMTSTAQQTIVSFISNTTYFPITVSVKGTTSSPPTAASQPTTQARDIARAALQAILTSPEYSIQQ